MKLPPASQCVNDGQVCAKQRLSWHSHRTEPLWLARADNSRSPQSAWVPVRAKTFPSFPFLLSFTSFLLSFTSLLPSFPSSVPITLGNGIWAMRAGNIRPLEKVSILSWGFTTLRWVITPKWCRDQRVHRADGMTGHEAGQTEPTSMNMTTLIQPKLSPGKRRP